jgi:hypothetical protein
MNAKKLFKKLMRLYRAYTAAKKGQKKIAGASSVFSSLIDVLEDGQTELIVAKKEIGDEISELMARVRELEVTKDGLDFDEEKAHKLTGKLKELTA